MKAFESKVRVERRSLRLLNDQFGKPQLRALSTVAVRAWLQHHSHADELSVLILRLSASVCSMPSRSGERLSAEFDANAQEVERLLVELQSLLQDECEEEHT